MKDRPANASIFTLGAGLLVLTAAAAFAPAHAQPAHPAARAAPSADLVLCDRLAADPSDPDKPADIEGTAAIGPSDVPLALKYCKIAAPGSRRALYQLGRAYAANQQMPDAIAAYRKAADKGSSSAMVELGVLLANGTGLAKDQAQAHELFRRAAEAGNPRGTVNLVALSSDGGPPIDPAQARTMLARAAENNSAEAQFQLGLMEANGVGGPSTVSPRERFSKKPPRKIIRARSNRRARSRRPDGAARPTRRPPKPITREQQRSATTAPRRR